MKRHARWLIVCAIVLVGAVAIVELLPERAEPRGPVIRFWGAARRVGGSCLIVANGDARFIVDCGALGEGASGALPPRPDSLDFAIITHAHIDHCGLLAELFAAGFRGHVYCTAATAKLVPLMLAMERGISREKVAREAYDRSIAALTPVPFGEVVEERGVSFRLMRAEHLLGAAWVDLALPSGADTVRLVVSGDLGSGNSVLLPPLEMPRRADYVVMESTYGGTRRDSTVAAQGEGEPSGGAAGSREAFAEAVARALRGGGDVLIPSFTLGRTQEAMAVLDMFMRRGVIPPETEVFVDSPTARKITGVYRECAADLSARSREAYPREPLRFPTLREVRSRTSLKVHARTHVPAVFITSSGDLSHANAPRHFMRMYGDPRNLLCIIGWQAPGSLGRRLLQGESPVLVRHQEGTKVMQDWVSPALAVKGFTSFSAHADSRGLLAWLGAARGVRHVFLVHGEESQALALAGSIRDLLALDVTVPRRGEGFVLTPRGGAVPKRFERSPVPAPDTLARSSVEAKEGADDAND
jgi:metallo-beta-lactamase family protein